jgi:putative serine protease PepD
MNDDPRVPREDESGAENQTPSLPTPGSENQTSPYPTWGQAPGEQTPSSSEHTTPSYPTWGNAPTQQTPPTYGHPANPYPTSSQHQQPSEQQAPPQHHQSSSPPQYPPAYPLSSPSAAPRRGGRVIAAALLVGALAGGAAGVGGAALVGNDSNASTSNADALTRGDDTSSNDGSTAASAAAIQGTTEAAAAKALPSVVKIYATGPQESGSGSGIILTDDGQILTNNHVVELAANGGSLAVSFNDGSTAKATIVGRDPLTDLAVIQADGVSGLTPATLGDSDTLKVGQQVVAVGSPFGLESTVTTGIVSALNRPVSTQSETATDPATIFPAIQTDAAINPGNSGGPLIDMSGQVVGIDAAIYSDSQTGQQSGSIGLGFAIPISDAIPIVEQLRNNETPTHARIGVSVGDASDQVGLPDGALVNSVDPGTAGAAAGLKKGDVITKVDDSLITDSDSLVATVRSYRPGDTVTLTVTSSTGNGQSTGDSHTVEVKLGSDES